MILANTLSVLGKCTPAFLDSPGLRFGRDIPQTVDEVTKLIVRSNVRIYGMEGNAPTWALHQSSVGCN